MRKTIFIAVLAVLVTATGFNASAQSTADELRAQIDALRANLDKNNPDVAIVAQLEALYAEYAEYFRVLQGPPPNDSCANAVPIGCGDTIAFSTLGATNDGNFSCAGPGGNEIWYSITGNGGNIEFSTCDMANYDTAINASTGSCGALNEVACNDDDPGCAGFTSILNLASVGGTDYLIGLGGFLGDTGTGTMTVVCEVPVALQGFDIE